MSTRVGEPSRAPDLVSQLAGWRHLLAMHSTGRFDWVSFFASSGMPSSDRPFGCESV